MCREVASSNKFKRTERSHLCSSLSYAHYKLSAEYHKKRRLRIQNRSAGCILSCTSTSRQQEVALFLHSKTSIPVLSTSLQSEHCPSDIYSSGAHSGSLSPSSGDILDIQFLGLQLREILAHVCKISSHKFLSYTQVSQFMGSLNWASGLNAFCHLHLRLLQ